MSSAEVTRKPLPAPDADTADFWRGLKNGKLFLQHCGQCQNVQYYQQSHCRRCGSGELIHRPASGRGKVHSFSVVHRAPGSAFKSDAPYAVLLVELAEGPRMISTFTDGDPNEVTFDMDVALAFDPVSDEITLPRFRKA